MTDVRAGSPRPESDDGPADAAVRERLLRRLALGEAADVREDVALRRCALANPIDVRSETLVRLGALLAVDPAGPMLRRTVQDALEADVTPDQVVGLLVSLIPTIGGARVTAVAPELGLAIGYDVTAALETLETAVSDG